MHRPGPRWIVATLAALAVLAALGPAQRLAPADAAEGQSGCAVPLLPAPGAGRHVAPGTLAAVAARSGLAPVALQTQAAGDASVWADTCGFVFFREASPVQGPPTGVHPAGKLPASLSRTFQLESRPGARLTIFLKFTGTTLTGSAFNADFGLPTIPVPPFSLAPPADTAFSDYELGEIQRAWQVVSEDFAPFDVNVTTRTPTADALDRTSAEDQHFGVTAYATRGGGPLQSLCSCGGLAYSNVFGAVGPTREYRLPALVFGGFSGETVGENLSHEIGHLFGLYHDGTALATYYEGRAPWAPIMGSGFSQPVSQWSAGEYLGATNLQDDLAVISRTAPLRADDHGDQAASATRIAPGTPVSGVVSSRGDVDAFTFTAAGPVTMAVTTQEVKANLDVGLTLLDASGRTIAKADPLASRVSSSRAQGLGVTWSGTLPRTASSYTVLLDGVGTGLPALPGRYSDYASLGAYRLLVTPR